MNPTTRKLTFTIPLLLAAGLLALMFHTASGAALLKMDAPLSSYVIYVDGDATGAATGQSWYSAYTNLQDALAEAATLAPTSTVEIWVAEGVYYPDEGAGQIDDDIWADFTLTNSVELYGGFAGDEKFRSQRDWQEYVTVLSGDLDQNDTTDAHGVVTDTANIMGTNAYHVVTGHGVTTTARLDGFSVTAGKAIDGGGGMTNNQSNPTLDNLIFSGNDAGDAGGGGMHNNQSSPMLNRVTFSGNSTDGGGGGMHNYYSSPTLDNVTFSGNSARWGGGMCNTLGSTPTLNNVTFSGNYGGMGGGGMDNHESSPTLTNVTFSDNQAGTEGGGGMRNDSGSNPTLTDVTFSGNEALWAGGGMYNDVSSPTLNRVTFSDNDGDWHGGGMYNFSSSPTLTYVTFTVNTADHGGGMYNVTSSLTLAGVNFSGNTATDEGGGMYNKTSSPTLVNVSFSDNEADDGGGMYNFSSSPTLNRVTFSGNAASHEHGGGMYNDTSSPTLDNVIFSGNAAAAFGGGMFNFYDSSPILTNVSFAGNVAGNSGGGMYNRDDYDCNPAIRNSILWGNQDSHGTGVYAQIDNPTHSPPLVISYTLVQGYAAWGIDYDGNLEADPLFVTPVDPNDAPTTEGNLRLQEGSPAIDAGNNSYVTVPTDLDGRARILGNAVDMGAYEHLKPLYLPLVVRSWPAPPFR
jgi:hypothetical protein